MNDYEPIFFTPPSGPTRNRRLFKGNKGDGGAAERKASEEDRVARAIAKINGVFGLADEGPAPRASMISRFPGFKGTMVESLGKMFGGSQGISAEQAAARMGERENLYSTIGNDATNAALFGLNKEKDVIERDSRFGLARAGLSGGSRDIDLNKDILDTYQQGVLRAGEVGVSAGNNARSADDRTRVSLINSIRAGLDEGSAQQQAYESMRNNSRSAQDAANGANLTGFFNGLKDVQREYQYNQGVQEATRKYPGTGKARGSSGDVREAS